MSDTQAALGWQQGARDAQASVARALECARAALAIDPAAAPSLDALATAAGVSLRTLQRHFARALQQSPHAAMQRLRLAGARQTLQSGEASSVLAAAMRHGFDHPGRFSILYARVFGEAPSATLRAARGGTRGAAPASATPLMLLRIRHVLSEDADRARHATDDLAIALGRTRDIELCIGEAILGNPSLGALRLEGRLEAGWIVLTLSRPTRGIVLKTWREPLSPRIGGRWAERAVGAVLGVIAAERIEQARRTPRHRVDVETLVTRARPAALTQAPMMVAMALDLLEEALARDPMHARAQALAGWARAVGANHCFTRDAEGERARAVKHTRRALALAIDDPEVLTLSAGVMSLTRQLDEAQSFINRSLALDPNQPEAFRRLGFIQNFRGNGRAAAAAFRHSLQAWSGGHDGNLALVGLGIANFIQGDYGHAARALARALDQQPSCAWPYRFLAAAAMHAEAPTEARRAMASLQRFFPDLTVSRCAQSDVLPFEAKERVLDGLARAGLPY